MTAQTKNHRVNKTARLGDRVKGLWYGQPVAGVLVASAYGGFVTIVLDTPVDFRPGDPRTDVSFHGDQAHQWWTVADGPALEWADVSGSFDAQALTPSGLAKCGLVRSEDGKKILRA